MADDSGLLPEWRSLLPDFELVSVITAQFRDSRIVSSDVVEYGPEESPALRIHYRKRELDGLEFLEPDSTILVAGIDAAVRAEAESTGDAICRSVLFTQVPVRGWWHHDEVRVTHLPPDAPIPKVLVGRWPFYLEYPVRDSADPFLRSQRQTARLRELTCLLNALIHFHIALPPRSSQSEWIVTFQREPFSTSLVYGSPGYIYDDPRATPGQYIPVADNEALGVESHAVHFGHFGIDRSELTVSSTLGKLLDAYLRLPAFDRTAFARACYWQAFAGDTELISSSAAVAARVQAIESLLPPTPMSRCVHCGSATGPSIGERFLHFLQEFAPGVSDPERKDLYTQRSKILHGGGILHGDLAPGFGHLSPLLNEEHRLGILSSVVTQRVLVNWLAARVNPPIPPLGEWKHQKLGGLRQVRATIGPGAQS